MKKGIKISMKFICKIDKESTCMYMQYNNGNICTVKSIDISEGLFC